MNKRMFNHGVEPEREKQKVCVFFLPREKVMLMNRQGFLQTYILLWKKKYI